jgi:hypothetical protein
MFVLAFCVSCYIHNGGITAKAIVKLSELQKFTNIEDCEFKATSISVKLRELLETDDTVVICLPEDY